MLVSKELISIIKKMADGAIYHQEFHLVKVIRRLFLKGFQMNQENIAYIFLYDSVTNLQIGINEDSSFEIVKNKDLPVVFMEPVLLRVVCFKTWYSTHQCYISKLRI